MSPCPAAARFSGIHVSRLQWTAALVSGAIAGPCNAGDRAGVCLRRIASSDGKRFHLRIEHAARLDLVPVVIFGVDPEDRDGRDAMFGLHLLGESERGERFQKREERPAEQSGLLPCDNGNRLRIAQ